MRILPAGWYPRGSRGNAAPPRFSAVRAGPGDVACHAEPLGVAGTVRKNRRELAAVPSQRQHDRSRSLIHTLSTGGAPFQPKPRGRRQAAQIPEIPRKFHFSRSHGQVLGAPATAPVMSSTSMPSSPHGRTATSSSRRPGSATPSTSSSPTPVRWRTRAAGRCCSASPTSSRAPSSAPLLSPMSMRPS